MIWKETVKVIALVMMMLVAPQSLASAKSAPEKPVAEKKHAVVKEKVKSDGHESAAKEMPGPPKEIRTQSSYAKLPSGEFQPWRMMRKLQKIQDNIAAGKPGALEEYRRMLVDYSDTMLNYGNEYWSHERNLDAATLYVLVGGNPQVGIHALENSSLGNVAKYTLKAAIAYNQRNVSEAYNMMNEIDPSVLPPSLAAQFALTRAMVTSSIDLDLTTKYLMIARKLAPGTLIEEASLRRQLRISGRKKNFDDFKYLSSTYIRRFGNSHYIGDFLRSFAYGIIQMPSDNQMEALEELKALFEDLSQDQILVILAYVARNATILGKTKLAHWSANQALEKFRPGSKLHTRMKLYAVASGIINEEHTEELSKLLTEIEMEALDLNDKKLFGAVSALSLRLQSEPLDSGQLKKILRDDQQTFPGEEPKMPEVLKNQTKFLNSNAFVMRFDKLSKNFDAAMADAAKLGAKQ